MAATDVSFEKGLPSNLEAERLILGSILLDGSQYLQVAGVLEPEDFSLEKHQLIFARMGDLQSRGEPIDRISVAEELLRRGQLDACDGISYLVSLDDGLPRISNLEGYVRIVKDKALLRRLIRVAQNTMNRCLLAGEEAGDILAGAEEALLKLGDSRARSGLMRPKEVIEAYEGGLNTFLDPSKRIKGISTGFTRFDELTGGLHSGELIIVAARPSMGKTAFALNIAHHVACKLKKTVAVFSLEMSQESLLQRMLCSAARVDGQRFRVGHMEQDERYRLTVAANQLVSAPLFIDDSAGVSLIDIHSRLRRVKAEHGLDLVVIDYLQLMTARGKYENRVQEVSSLSRGLKLLAKELAVPMMVLSQLSRAPDQRKDDHRPQLSDLRDSGSIEQDADVVAFIYREGFYKRDRRDLDDEAELILSKQRNGPTGPIQLVFLKAYTRFENYTRDLPESSASDGSKR